MQLEYKRCATPFEVKELVAIDGGGWEVSGYASSFHDADAPAAAADFYGDLILAGAFSDSIAARKTKLLYEHREPIGYQLDLHEDTVGLFGRWAIVDTSVGADAYKLMKAGVLDGLSIGFFAEDWLYREDGIRLVRKIQLVEVSGVAIPADSNAVITDVKHGAVRPFAAHSSDVRVAVRSWVDRVRSGSELRGGEGKAALTDERRAAVADMSGSLRSAADELDALVTTLTTPPAAERRHHDLDALRARLTRLGVLGTEGDPR